MGGFIRSVLLDRSGIDSPNAYPFNLAALQHLDELVLHPSVTFIVGENGSGKSTFIEAIAVAAGFNAEGGSRNFDFSTRDSTSGLHRHLKLVSSPSRPRTGYFLRAESFYNVATRIEELDREPGAGRPIADSYGDKALHEQSHGESFLALVLNRFGPNGLYVMDEPEAAMSPQGCLAMLRAIHELVAQGSQFIIATHSPLLVAYPDADVHQLDDGIEKVAYDQTRNFQLFRSFTEAPERYLRPLLED